LKKSLAYLEEAYLIRESVNGKYHSLTALSIDNLALLYNRLGNYDKSLEFSLLSLKLDLLENNPLEVPLI
jgi:hypothetical protein